MRASNFIMHLQYEINKHNLKKESKLSLSYCMAIKNTHAFEHHNTVKNLNIETYVVIKGVLRLLKSWYDTTNFIKTAISINTNFNNNERQ